MFTKHRIFILIGLIGTAIAFTIDSSTHTAYKVKWLVAREGIVKVDGSTNVNKFSCSVSGYSNADTITCYKKFGTDIVVLMEGKLSIPVSSFDCLNKMMTKDLRKTLKASDFPMLTIYFVSLERYPELKTGQEYINGIVDIELAGTKKRIGITLIISTQNQVYHLMATQSVHFSDFNLVPPKKMGGVIKANDRLDVTFNMDFKVMTD